MAKIIPFHGTRYDTTVVGDVNQVVAPPYDIIDAAGQKALHDRHPQNIIRLELGLDQPGDGPTHNRYTRAALTLRDWLKSGVLKRDAQPTLYYHTIEYTPPSAPSGSPTKTLKGFLATVKLEALDSGLIYPHENTRSAAKTDRLNLLEACKTNFSPIWSLYSDPQGAVMGLLERAIKGEPASIDFRDDVGFRQQLWTVADPAVLKHAVDAWASASGAQKAIRYADAQTVRWAEYGMNTYFRLLLGLAVALFGIVLTLIVAGVSLIWGPHPAFDAAVAIAVGLLLGAMATFLAAINRKLLIDTSDVVLDVEVAKFLSERGVPAHVRSIVLDHNRSVLFIGVREDRGRGPVPTESFALGEALKNHVRERHMRKSWRGPGGLVRFSSRCSWEASPEPFLWRPRSGSGRSSTSSSSRWKHPGVICRMRRCRRSSECCRTTSISPSSFSW